jgi:hypothetical protein
MNVSVYLFLLKLTTAMTGKSAVFIAGWSTVSGAGAMLFFLRSQ